MATVRLAQKTYNNFSGGYACEQAYLEEKLVSFIGESKNIDIYSTRNNNGYGFKKMLGNTLYYSIPNEKIINLFKFNYSKDKEYLVVHTVTNTYGKLYYIDDNGDLHLIKGDLNKNATESAFTNFSQTLPTKRYLGLFSNGVDPIIKIELGVSPEVEIIDATDSENRPIRSTMLEVYYGRVWCGVDDRIHWSKSLDPFVWATEEDDAGWAQLDSDVVSIMSYAGGLLVSTKKSIYYCTKDGSGGFMFTVLSPNNAASTRSLLKHDNYALYVANDGIYPVGVTQENTKKVEENIAWLIQNYFSDLDVSRKSDIFGISVTSMGRNEVWYNLPIAGDPDHSYVFIYRFKTGRQTHYYWLPPRIQPKINCMLEFKNMILTGDDNGNILQELKGKTFNGGDIEAIAEFPEFDFNGTHNKQKFKLFAYVEAMENNHFYLDYFFDGDINPDRQEVNGGDDQSMLVWGEKDWDADDSLWVWETSMEIMLDKPRKHNRLSLRFIAEDSSQDFAINKLSTTRVKVKNK